MLLSRGIAGLRSLAEAKEGMLGIRSLRSWLYRKKQNGTISRVVVGGNRPLKYLSSLCVSPLILFTWSIFLTISSCVTCPALMITILN